LQAINNNQIDNFEELDENCPELVRDVIFLERDFI